MKKVIVHDGIFHADDVMSVALIKEFVRKSIPVERTRNISAEDINNPDVWVVDVGGVYDYKSNNYDHHQDKSLPASCVLVLRTLHFRDKIDTEIWDELSPAIQEISDIDCNGPAGKTGFQFNTLIKSFNSLENGFEKAVEVCRMYIQTCKISVENSKSSLHIWKAGYKVSEYIRVCKAFPIHWKRYAQQPILIYPNAGKWTVISANSEEFPLHSTGKESFMHANKFLAVFDSKEDAIACGQASEYNIIG